MRTMLFSKSSGRVSQRLWMSGSLLLVAMLLSVPNVTVAGSATWDLNPGSGDWNTATNWTPATVPNGSLNLATFGRSNTTDVSISANTEVNGITFTSAATNPYTITAGPGSSGRFDVFTLTISGSGITNNSGITQNFATVRTANASIGEIIFTNSATAGNSTIFINNGGPIFSGGATAFDDHSSAGSGTFINEASTSEFVLGGGTFFNGNSTAGNATFINKGGASTGAYLSSGMTRFGDAATAGNATFTNTGGAASGTRGGVIEFGYASSSAGNATITNNGGTVNGAEGGFTSFGGTAANATIINEGGIVSGAAGGSTFFGGTAANATIINNGGTVNGAGGGFTLFDGTADSATLIANGGIGGGEGGGILFRNQSTGGTARVEVFGNGNLDIGFMFFPHDLNKGVTVGSIEGDGNVFLGAKNLTVGSNNLSTIFAGVIQDGGRNSDTGGSLTKIGTGMLDLTGTNTYTGNTIIGGGVLKVDGSIASNAVVNRFGKLAGIGTVSGSVTVHTGGRVSPGDSPGILTVDSYTQTKDGALLIDIAGLNAGQVSVLNVLGNATLNGNLRPVLLDGFVPAIGDSFTFMNYADLTGQFSKINGQVFDNRLLQWSVSYQSNHAILTVGPNTIPEHASTLLLLTLSLLGLVTYRQAMLHYQA